MEMSVGRWWNIGMVLTGGQKHVTVPLCAPQISQLLTWGRTWIFAVLKRKINTNYLYKDPVRTAQ